MTIEEIKALRLRNQHLLQPQPMAQVLHDLNGVQAQFVGHALHALRIRSMEDADSAYLDTVVKGWTVRGTLHLFAQEDLPLYVRCHNGTRYRLNDWSVESFWNQRPDWALTPERQRMLAECVLSALQTGEKSREELKAVCREQGMSAAEERCMFHGWGGGMRQLCDRGFIHYVVSEKKRYRLCPDYTPMRDKEAELEIMRRYFTHFGPATLRDAAYYSGQSQAKVKRWMDALPLRQCLCADKTYYWIDRDSPTAARIPDCLFLAGFDQLLLGYEKCESPFFDKAHLRRIFNMTGIVMPTILLHGSAVGRWKKEKQKLTLWMFQKTGRGDQSRICAAANALWKDIHIVVE